MHLRPFHLALSCTLCLTIGAADKPFEAKVGEGIPAKIIYTDHLGPFKHDLPAVLPLVVVSFQTQATEKGRGGGIFSSGTLQYTLEGISPALMQKITDQVQEALEAELKAGGWQIIPAEQAVDLDAYKTWAKSPDPSGAEMERSVIARGKGVNSLFASKELERVFVGGKRPLVGNGTVLGGWAGAPAICKLGLALNAKVILFRGLVNFANIETGKRGLFTGNQSWKSSTVLEVSYAELDVYPPDASGATPARLHTEVPVTLFSDFIMDAKKDGSHHTLTANPERYEKDTLEALRAVAKGFVAVSNK